MSGDDSLRSAPPARLPACLWPAIFQGEEQAVTHRKRTTGRQLPGNNGGLTKGGGGGERDRAMCGVGAAQAQMICDVTYLRVHQGRQELLWGGGPELSVGGHDGRTHRQRDTQ